MKRKELVIFIERAILLILKLAPLETHVYEVPLLSICLLLDLVYFVQTLGENGKHNVEQEERAKNDKQNAEDDGHPGDVGVHHVVHDFGPAFESDHLEDCYETDAKIVEDGDSIVNHLVIDGIIDVFAEAPILRTFTEPIRGALVVAHSFFRAQVLDIGVVRPRTIGIGLFGEPAPLVDTAAELLNAKDPK